MPSYWIARGFGFGVLARQLVQMSNGDLVLPCPFGAAPQTMGFSVLSSEGVFKKTIASNITDNSPSGSVLALADGGLLYGLGPGTAPAFVTRLNSALSVTASCRFGSGSSKPVGGLCEASDGSIFVGLNETSKGGFGKFTGDLSALTWASDYTVGVAVSDIIEDSGGDVYCKGHFVDGSTVKSIFIKTNSSGVVQWAKTLASASGNLGNTGAWRTQMCRDSAGSFYVTGVAVTNTRAFLVKYDSAGTVLWQRYITVSAGSTHNPVVVTDGTSVYLVFQETTTRLSVFKYDSAGAVLWKRYFADAAFIASYALCSAAIVDGGTGLVVSTSNSTYGSAIVIKVPTDGTKTGVYGSTTYTTSTAAEAAGALTVSTTTLTAANTNTRSAFSAVMTAVDTPVEIP